MSPADVSDEGRMPTPEEWKELLKNSPTPEQSTEAMARAVALSQRFNEALRQAERGLRDLADIARNDEEGMANSAARELVRIVTNTLLAMNSPQAAQGKGFIRIDNEPETLPNSMSDPVWPEVFKRLARIQECWPVLYYVHPEHRRLLTEAVILGFEVGEDSGINTKGSFTAANIVVLQLKAFIDQYRGREFQGDVTINHPRRVSTIDNPGFKELLQSFASLPRLSREINVLKLWQKAGNGLLPFLFGKELEKSPHLIGLVIGQKTETGDPHAERDAATWKKRDLIRKAVRKAWRFVPPDE